MKLRSSLLGLSLAALLSAPVLGSTVVHLSLDQLVAESDAIVVGRVESMKPRWVDRVLVTDVTVATSRWIEGSGGDRIVVTLPGGADFDRKFPVSMSYPGAPTLAPNEDVMLFLTSSEEFGSMIAGFSQGKFTIVTQGGESVVRRDLTGTVLTSGSGVVEGGPEVAIPLDSFIADVKASAAKKAAR